MTDKSEAQKKQERAAQHACTPMPKPTAADIARANERHGGPHMPDAAPEVMFTELGWAVCRAGWIVQLFDDPAEAHAWLNAPQLIAA